MADLLAQLAQDERDGPLPERLQFFRKLASLIADEIVYLLFVAGAGNLFFQLVNARYERGAMLLTSNRGFSGWGDAFGDPAVDTALLDRLLHYAAIVQIDDSSGRLGQHAKLMPEHVRSKAIITHPYRHKTQNPPDAGRKAPIRPRSPG